MRAVLAADHKRATGRAAAADIKHREGLRAVHLIVARRAGHLPITIEHLTHPGRADRMTRADQPAARIDRQLPTHLDYALRDRLPRFTGLRYSEMIDRHVFRGRKAVMRLDPVDREYGFNSGAREGVEYRLTGVRQYVGVIAALGDFGVKFHPRRMMAPAANLRDGFELAPDPFRIAGGKLLRRQENDRAAVADLRAVAHLDPSGDRLVELFPLLRIVLAARPVTRLRQRIASRVGVVHGRDLRQVLVLETEALVIFVAEPSEQAREWIFLALAFTLVPARGAEEIAAGGSIDGFHLLEADHRRAVVAPGLDLRRRRQNRHRARGARRLMTRGRQAGEGRIEFEEKCPELSLLRIEFGGEITDVRGLDVARLQAAGTERGRRRLTHHFDKVLAFLVPVAREIALRSS